MKRQDASAHARGPVVAAGSRRDATTAPAVKGSAQPLPGRAVPPASPPRGRMLRAVIGTAAAGAAVAMLAGCGAVATDGIQRSTPTGSHPSTSQESSMHTYTPPSDASAATRSLFTAVQAADVAAVRKAIAAGADLEARDPHGRTPLVEATKSNRVEVATALLDAGANPNAKDDLQDSAYLYAGAEGLDDILRATLKHGADVRSTNRYGGTALIPASEHAHVSTVRILIAAGVPVNHVNNLSWTALHEAIVLGNGDADHVEVVRLLLAAGADQSIPDGDGVLPRRLAQLRGFDGIVAELDRAAR